MKTHVIDCNRLLDHPRFSELSSIVQDTVEMRAFGNKLQDIADTYNITLQGVQSRIYTAFNKLVGGK